MSFGFAASPVPAPYCGIFEIGLVLDSWVKRDGVVYGNTCGN